jgi:hypothetical protein
MCKMDHRCLTLQGGRGEGTQYIIVHAKMMPEFTLYAAFTNSIIAEIAVLNLVS